MAPFYPGPQKPPRASGGCEPPLESSRGGRYFRSPSAPAADRASWQENSCCPCVSDVGDVCRLSPQAPPTPQRVVRSIGEEQQAMKREPLTLGHTRPHPRTSSLVGCSSSCSCRTRAASTDGTRAGPAPAAQPTSCPSFHLDFNMSVVSPPFNSTHTFPASRMRRSSSAVISYWPAARPTLTRSASAEATVDVHQRPHSESHEAADFDFSQERTRGDGGVQRPTAVPEVRRRWPCGRRTSASAPLLLQLTSPSSSTALLQLEAIRAQNASSPKLSSFRPTCAANTEHLPTGADPSLRMGSRMATYPTFPQVASNSHSYTGSARRPSSCSAVLGIPRGFSAPALAIQGRRNGGTLGGHGATGAIGEPTAAYKSGSKTRSFGSAKFHCRYKSACPDGPISGLSRSWIGLTPYSDTDLSTLGTRSFSEPLLHPPFQLLAERSFEVAAPLQTSQVRGSIRSHPYSRALSAPQTGLSDHIVQESFSLTRVGNSRLNGEVIEPAREVPDDGFAVGFPETLIQQRASPEGVEMEGFVQGVQSCISRIISNFPSGFELHNGYGDLVVPEYWTSEIPCGQQMPGTSHRCMSSGDDGGCKRTMGTRIDGPPSRRVSLPTAAAEVSASCKGGCPESDFLQASRDGIADTGLPGAMGPEVVFAIGALPAETSAAAASCYYSVEGVVGRGAHGAVFRAKRIVKVSRNSSPTATTPAPGEDNTASGGSTEKPEPPGELEEVEVEEDEVALKIIDLDGALRTQCADAKGRARYVERVLVEANVLAQLDHEHVVKFYEAFQWPPCYLVIVTEYIPGGSLRDLYKSAGPLPEAVIALVLKDIAKALEYLHDTPLKLDNKYKRVCIHRDIKAANILLTESGRAKLIDFGIANLTEADIEFAGTPQWMAPEVAEIFFRRHHQVTPYSCSVDIWSLGITAYELAMGCLPWPHKTKLDQLMHMIAYGSAPRINLNEGFEKSFCYFVEKCLRKNAGERGTASELLRHDFFAKFCSGKRPQSHQELKEAVETFNGKRQASVLTTVVRYFNFWGRKGNGGSLIRAVAKRRMPVGRLENWGSGEPLGNMKPCGAGSGQQNPPLSLVSSSSSVIFPGGSSIRGASLSGPRIDQAADANTSSPSPAAGLTDGVAHNTTGVSVRSSCMAGPESCGRPEDGSCSSAERPPETLAPQEWPVSASGCEMRVHYEQKLCSSGEPGCDLSGNGAQLPIDEGLTSTKTNVAVPSAPASVSSQSQEARQERPMQEETTTAPPQSSQSFFSFFLSAFQGSMTATLVATPPVEPVDVERHCGGADGLQVETIQEPPVSLPSEALGLDPPRASVRNAPLPKIGGPGHPLPRRFRKTRNTGTRKRSRHRETKTALSRGADRFFGLLKRVGMVNENLTPEASKNVHDGNSEVSGGAVREKGMDCGESSVPDATRKCNGHHDSTRRAAPGQPGPQCTLHGCAAPPVSSDGGAKNDRSSYTYGCREVSAECDSVSEQSHGSHDADDISEEASLVQPDMPSSRPRSTHFCSLLESPTAPGTGLPLCSSSHLATVQELTNKWDPISSAEHPRSPMARPDQPVSACPSEDSPPGKFLQGQSCDTELRTVSDGGVPSPRRTDAIGLPPTGTPRNLEEHPCVGGCGHDREDTADSGSDRDTPFEGPCPSELQASKAREDERGWLPGPYLYKRLLDGIAQLVEDSGIRRPTSVGSVQRALPDDARRLSSDIRADEDLRRDPCSAGLERSHDPQAPCGNTGPTGNQGGRPGGEASQSAAPQSSWLWNLISRDQESISKCEARDPSSVAASYLADAGPHSEALAKAQRVPCTRIGETCGSANQTPKASFRPVVCEPVEQRPAELPNRACLPFDEIRATEQPSERHRAGERQYGDNVAPFPTRKAPPVVSMVDRVRFTTFADDLARQSRRQQVPLEYFRTGQERAYYGSPAHGPSFSNPAPIRALHLHLQDPLLQQPVFISAAPAQWVLHRQYPPGFTRALGFDSGGLGAFVPNTIPAPAGWEAGQQVAFPVRWDGGAGQAVPPYHMTNSTQDVHEIILGPDAREQPAQP